MLDQLITAWHDAVNTRDLAAARAVVTDPVDVSGPRGTHTITAEAFTDWIIRSGIRLTPLAARPIDPVTTVVTQEATWSDDPAPRTVATIFRLRDGRIGGVHRYDSPAEALRALE